MPWYHWIATFLNDALPRFRATRRTNLALLTAAILERRTLVILALARSWQVQLPYSHHRRKKRLFRFLSNAAFDTVAAPMALLAPICQAARLRGTVPIMIDWSAPRSSQGQALGQGTQRLVRGGLFPGLRSALAQLGRHAGGVEPIAEPRRGILHRPAVAPPCPPTSAPCYWRDRSFGRASLLRFVQQMPPPHRLPSGLSDPSPGRPCIRYGGRLWWYRPPSIGGGCATIPCARGPHSVSAPNSLSCRWRRSRQPDPLLGPGDWASSTWAMNTTWPPQPPRQPLHHPLRHPPPPNRVRMRAQGYRIWIWMNCARMLMRKLLSQPARFSLPRMEPLLGSNLARVQRQLAQQRQVFRTMPFPVPRLVFVAGYVQHPMQPVLHSPMSPHNVVAPLRRPILAQRVVAGLLADVVLLASGGAHLAHGRQARPVMPFLQPGHQIADQSG